MSKYTLTVERAKELDNDPELYKDEVKVMKAAFIVQGNQGHTVGMSAHLETAQRTDRVYRKLVNEYYKKYGNA